MRVVLIICFLLISFYSEAEDWGIFNSKPSARFKITVTTPYKQIYNEALKYYVLKESKNHISNHFCLIGYDWSDGRRSAVVFWNEGQYIFSNWELGHHPDEDAYMSLNNSDIIDQNTAVFTPEKLRKLYTEDEIRRNPDIIPMYGYRQKDVDQQRGDCEKYGEEIVIYSFSRPKNCNDSDDPTYVPEEIHLCDAIGK